jgi:hypothetical protein
VAMLELWPTLAERNAFIPPSRVRLPEDPAGLDPLHRRLVQRFAADLPGPLPPDLFDVPSARVAGELVACALARLQPGLPLGARLLSAAAALPPAASPAAHATQAALLWHAVPLARRLLSDAFRALNAGRPAESAEAVGALLHGLLARLPLLSFRADAEELFVHAAPPPLDGFLGPLGFRRWLLQRLASPTSNAAALARRAAALRQLPDVELRALLVLRPDPALIPALAPLLERGQWPPDLAPGLRAQAVALRTPTPEEDAHDD